MIGSQLIVLSIGLLALGLKCVHSLSEAEEQKILTFLVPHITECIKENPLTSVDVQAILQHGNFKSLNPCFSACLLKKVGLMNDKGMFDADKAVEYSKQYFSIEDQKKVPGGLKDCEGINDKPVSDGDKGCERVKLLAECGSNFISSIYPK